MSVAEIKNELKNLDTSEVDEVAAFILQMRRAKDPARKSQLADMIDNSEWVERKPDSNQ